MHGFEIVKHEELPEIDGEAIEYAHAASGAKLLFLKNDDNNKSFAIGFRTPPADDTGVFHILEHSVLCGSRRFPVKEPFVDLLKSSMQTFLNAMTFSDKTLYPVASTNEQDLYNLMDVYLDAVFHPNIYSKRQIFEQEGWHYELDDNGALSYNGVVFNEMKGALSDANSVLYDELQAGLFPGTCYSYESGGTPEAIPTLTYEGYLDEHRRHYRTDNSYIILYGNLDIDRALAWLDERYLGPVAAEQRERDEARANEGLEPLVARTIEECAAVHGSATRPMKTAPENACAGTAYVIGNSRERKRVLAVDILLDALLGSNEAPLKRALLDAGIAHDVQAFVADAMAQPFAVIQLQMPAEGQGLAHAEAVKRELERLLDGGLDHELIEAALSHEEFTMREHNFGIADGVMHAMNSLTGWLYDDGAATDYLRYEEAFAELREKLDEGYFETLARKLICENDHVFTAEVVPTPDLEDPMAGTLATIEADLTDDDRARIAAEVTLLRELQEAPDAPEDTAKLPRLALSDVGDAPAEPDYGFDEAAPIPCVRHRVSTHGIAYAYRYFDLNAIAFEDMPYVSILAGVLGKLDTAHHSAAEIDTLVQGKLGNLTFYTDMYERADDLGFLKPKFIVSASALPANVEWLATLPREVLLETDFSNTGKILDVLKQRKIGMEHGFTNSGHSCAATRVKSYYARSGVLREQLGNVDFYRFLCDLIEHFDERAESLVQHLEAVAARLFVDGGCLMSFAGDDDEYARFWAAKPQCGRAGDGEARLVVPEPVKRNEAFVTPSDVCYAGLGWDYRLFGATYSGAWGVAARALSYDFLWNEVRVKGGAYGVGFQALRSGNMRFYSYRDPHLDETLARFAQSSEWLSAFDPADEDLEGFIVATLAKVDAPLKPRDLIRRQMSDVIRNRTPEYRERARREVVDTTAADIRAVAASVTTMVDQQAICVFGNREILEGADADLDVIELIG